MYRKTCYVIDREYGVLKNFEIPAFAVHLTDDHCVPLEQRVMLTFRNTAFRWTCVRLLLKIHW